MTKWLDMEFENISKNSKDNGYQDFQKFDPKIVRACGRGRLAWATPAGVWHTPGVTGILAPAGVCHRGYNKRY
jgi:hypothetical protein